jgi:FtsX-like permease family protein
MALLRLVVRRLVAQRLLALALLITMAFSIGVLVAGPVYLNASRQAILSGKLASSSVSIRNVRYTVLSGPGFDEGTANRAVDSTVRALPVQRVIPQIATVPVTISGPTGSQQTAVAYREGMFDHVTLNGGVPAGPTEVAISTSQAFATGVRVGDTLTLSVGGEASFARSVDVQVVATFKPPSGNDPFFFGIRSVFPQPGNPLSPNTNPILVSHEGIEQVLQSLGLDEGQQYSWDVYLALDGKSLDQVAAVPGAIQSVLTTLQHKAGLGAMQAATGLDAVVDLVRQLVANATVPIYLVVFQIAAVALAVLAGVATLALTNQSFELAVLKSRGFSRAQLLVAQGIESVLAAAGAVPLGLLFGLALARLGKSAHGPYLPGARFPIALNGAAIVAAVGGAVVGAGLLLVVSIPFVSRTVLQERHSASRETGSILGRFPIEVLVGVLGLGAFWEVRTHGIQPSIGTNTIDPLVLLAPTLLLFATSFAALRVMLWVFRRADDAIGRMRSLPRYLAGRRLGRSQSGGMAAALLLLLATGLLMVSSSYRGTVLRSHADTARTQLGADWNVQIDTSAQSLNAERRLPPNVMGVYRAQADLQVGVASQATILGVDPSRYATAGWWRGDFAARPLSALMSSLEVSETKGTLPAGTGTLAVTLTAPPTAEGLELAAVVLSANGRASTVRFGSLSPGQQVYRASAVGARRLISLVMLRSELFQHPAKHLILTFSRVQAIREGGASTDVPLSTWQPLRWRSSDADVVPNAAGGVGATIDTGFGDVIGGIVPENPDLPALVAPDVAQAVGNRFTTVVAGAEVQIHTVAVPKGFPGSTAGQSYLVVSQAPLMEILERVPEASDGLNEVWAMGPDDPTPAIRRAGLEPTQTNSALRFEASLAEDPQSLAVGMHFTAAAAGMVLVVVGVAVGVYFGQRRRRFEFAALRAMGTEPRQLVATLFTEEAVVVGFSLLMALALGYTLLRVMMPYLAPSVSAAFPPPLLVLDWTALGVFALAVVGMASAGLGLAARALLSMPVTSVLRGEAE